MFTMVVIGGLGSLPGAVLGAVYVKGAQYFLPTELSFFVAGIGLLVVLLVAARRAGLAALPGPRRPAAPASRPAGSSWCRACSQTPPASTAWACPASGPVVPAGDGRSHGLGARADAGVGGGRRPAEVGIEIGPRPATRTAGTRRTPMPTQHAERRGTGRRRRTCRPGHDLPTRTHLPTPTAPRPVPRPRRRRPGRDDLAVAARAHRRLPAQHAHRGTPTAPLVILFGLNARRRARPGGGQRPAARRSARRSASTSRASSPSRRSSGSCCIFAASPSPTSPTGATARSMAAGGAAAWGIFTVRSPASPPTCGLLRRRAGRLGLGRTVNGPPTARCWPTTTRSTPAPACSALHRAASPVGQFIGAAGRRPPRLLVSGGGCRSSSSPSRPRPRAARRCGCGSRCAARRSAAPWAPTTTAVTTEEAPASLAEAWRIALAGAHAAAHLDGDAVPRRSRVVALAPLLQLFYERGARAQRGPAGLARRGRPSRSSSSGCSSASRIATRCCAATPALAAPLPGRRGVPAGRGARPRSCSPATSPSSS